MRKSLWFYAAILLLVVAASSQALAQYESENASKFSLKVGVYRPSGERLRDEGPSMWKLFGANYDLSQDTLGRPTSYVTIERGSEEKDFFKGAVTSLQYYRLWHRNAEEARGLYYGGGVGAFSVSEEITEHMATPTDFVWGDKNSAIKPGLSVIGGYNLNESFFGEVRYSMVSELAKGASFSGLSFFIGGHKLF